MAVALHLIEEALAHLQQVGGAAAAGDGGMKGLVASVPDVEQVVGALHLHHLGEGMGGGQNLGLPGVVAALDGELQHQPLRSEERRVGKGVDLGGRRTTKRKYK